MWEKLVGEGLFAGPPILTRAKNAVFTLNINENSFITNRTSDDFSDPIDKAIDKYKFHPSTFLI